MSVVLMNDWKRGPIQFLIASWRVFRPALCSPQRAASTPTAGRVTSVKHNNCSTSVPVNVKFLRWTAWLGLISLLTLSCCYSSSRLDHFKQGGNYFGRGPSLSPDGSQIAFSSPRTGNGDIYLMMLNGTVVQRLTSSEAFECDASFSGNGKKIVFVRESEGCGDIWVMDSDGTNQKQLTVGNGDEGSPRFVGDGGQVVFWRNTPELESRVGIARSREIVLLDTTTSTEIRLTDNLVEDVFPSASRDGNLVGFVREGQLIIHNIKEKKETCLGIGGQLCFSPNGNEIAFICGNFGRQIDVMSIDGTNRRTVFSGNSPLENVTFVPDSSSLLFLSHTNGDPLGEFILTRLDGSLTSKIPERNQK